MIIFNDSSLDTKFKLDGISRAERGRLFIYWARPNGTIWQTDHINFPHDFFIDNNLDDIIFEPENKTDEWFMQILLVALFEPYKMYLEKE